MTEMKFNRTVQFQGRNGIFKCSGIEMIHMELSGNIRLYPITSKSLLGTGFIEVPVEELVNLVKTLETIIYNSLLKERERYDKELVKRRLEILRKELRGERISYGELLELQSLAEFIDPDDVELREAAGLPESSKLKRYLRSREFINQTVNEEE